MKIIMITFIAILNLTDFLNSQGISNTLGGNTSTDKFIVENSNSEAGLVVTGEGKVGIGTTTPTSKLEVAGTITATKFVRQGSNGLTGIPTTIEAKCVSKTTGTSPPSANAGKVTITFTKTFTSTPTLFVIVILRDYWAVSPDVMNMGEVPHHTITAVTKDYFELVVRFMEGGTIMEGLYVDVNYLAIGE